MTRPVLIIPGLHGSHAGHWQHWWRQDHADASIVQQADWSNPLESEWLEVAERAILRRPDSLIIAHSLGAILVAKLARSRVANRIAGALLVAPADITRTSLRHHRTYEFGAMPQDRIPFPTLVVASQDDPYMPYAKLVTLAGLWGSRIHDMGHVGHINVESGFGRWTQGYALAASVLPQHQLH
nr:alpha/beta hydrolase [uncultured Devosia sp.]